MAQELIVPTATIAVVVTQALAKLKDLRSQAERAEIDSSDAYDKGTDFIKILTGIEKRHEDKRKEWVEAPGRRIRKINKDMKPISDEVDSITQIIKAKMLGWYSAEQQRIKIENERKRKEAEDAAIEAAEQVEEEGDHATAEAIMNMASEVPEESNKPAIGRGELTGSSSVASVVWKGRVDNVRHVCKAIADGLLPEDLVTFSQSKLNAMARDQHDQRPDAEEIAQYGILYYGETGLSVR